MLRFLAPLLLAAPCLAAVSLTGPGTSQSDVQDRIDRLVDRIDDHRDRVHSNAFDQLGRIGTKAAFKALKKSVTMVTSERPVSAAYRAFAHFKGDDELREDAIDFLAKEAIGRRRRDSAPVAAGTLGEFGPFGRKAAKLVAGKSKDGEVRWQAVRPYLVDLATSGDEEDAELLLDCARPVLPDDMEKIEEALSLCKLPQMKELALEKLVARKTDTNMREILIRRYEADESPEFTDALLDVLALREPRVQRMAVEILSSRKDNDKARVRLWSFLDANDPQLRLVAIEGLARMSGDDERWLGRLKVLAKGNDPLDRQGAARALRLRPTAEAGDALHAMMDDADWRVRLEVVRQLRAVRDPRSVELLLHRMFLDTGRLRREIARSLRGLTGRDHGFTPERWQAWWEGEGASFSLPTLAEADAMLAELDKNRGPGATVATFYGLPVFSDRVAFVFDTSGSMNARAFIDGDEAAPAFLPRGGPNEDGKATVMDVARGQLLQLMKRLPDGAFCNIFFFSNKVDPWKRKLTALDERSRKKAIKFIGEKEAGGGTALYDALIEAFDDPEVDTIYILSDGLPSAGYLTDPQEIRAAIAELNATREVEIHGVDLSQASFAGAFGRSIPLVQWLAEDSGGRYIAPGAPKEEPEDDEEDGK